MHAAIVVSEINDKLSPNMAPPITDPTQNGKSKPDALETAAAIGTRSVIVPTDVPMATDTKQATTNKTATEKRAGINDSIQ